MAFISNVGLIDTQHIILIWDGLFGHSACPFVKTMLFCTIISLLCTFGAAVHSCYLFLVGAARMSFAFVQA